MKLYRHGDVGILACSPPPIKGREKVEQLTLADGEATGHSHRVVGADGGEADADLYLCGGKLYLKVRKAAAVVHQEHERIELPRGTYQILNQREWSPDGPRRVID